MNSHVKLLGHPIHQMLVVFPVGLLAGSAIFDIGFLAGAGRAMAVTAFWMIALGVAAALIAAPFGLVDWLAIPPGTRAKFIGAVHGIGNLVVVVLFAASLMLRWQARDVVGIPAMPYVMSFAGVTLALVTSWLGGELVMRLGIGVDDGANPDAPNSIRGPVVSVTRPSGPGA